MISITNNGASIQLNGDQNVTIVKRDVTKVQAIGINVLVVRNTNGIERKTAIPYTSVNSPATYPTAQALADYISSILGGFDTTSFIENSNQTYVAQVTSSPFPIPDTDLEVNGNAFVSVPSADPTAFDISVENTAGTDVGLIIGSTIEIADTQIEIAGVNEGSVPAETTAAIDIEDNLGNPVTPASVVKTGNTFLATLPTPPDISVLVNSVNEGNVGAGLNVEIELEDSLGNPVTPTSVTQASNVFTIEVPNLTLTVDFSADDTTPDTNQAVTFTDLTVGATQWQWDFGDGNTSTLQNPTHSYKYAGNYTVTLCATNGSISGKEVKTNYIAVTLQSIPTTNLQAWYKAPVGASPSNLTLVSGAISQWDDESGNGYHATQGTAVSRPLYSLTEITSPDGTVYGGGTFDGTNDFLSNVAAGFTRGTTSVMYMVFKQNSIASGTRVVFAAQNGLQGVSNLANNPQFRMISGANIDTLIAYPLANYFVVKFQYSNAGNASIKINDLIARAVSNTGASTDVGITIGGNIAGTAQSAISFVEGAIYSTALSAPNETSILNYFASKFGLWE